MKSTWVCETPKMINGSPSNATTVTTPPKAASLAKVLLISLPVKAIVDVAQSLGDLSGKVVIDATNSVFQKPSPYENGLEAFKAITGGDVVKGFNTTGFENMVDPVYDGQGVDMFTAGSSEHGKSIVDQLAKDAGFGACYDFGGDDKVPLIEQFALAWINLAIMQGQGRDIAFKVLRR